jgi:hypothetical protein
VARLRARRHQGLVSPRAEPVHGGPLLARTAWRRNWAMDRDPDGSDGQERSPFLAPDAEVQVVSQVMLAEYAALRAEVDQITPDTGPRGWLTPTAWNLLHPTQLAFEGVAGLALLTTALAAVYDWRGKAPAWGLLLGFAVLWVLGAGSSVALHRSFNRSAGT